MDNLRTLFLHIVVFLTGCAMLIIEIAGTRIIAPFYGSTIYVWSASISVALGFLAIGYWIGGLIADKKPDPIILWITIFLSGTSMLLIMKIDQSVLLFTDRFGLQYGPLVSATILFSPQFVLMGIVTPFVLRLRTKSAEHIGKYSGTFYAVGTVGSLVGALATGLYLLPSFSISQIFICSGFGLITLAIIGQLVFRNTVTRQGSNKGNNKGDLIAILLVPFLPISVFFLEKSGYKDNYTLKILHQQQGVYSDLKVIEIAGYRCITADGTTEYCRVISDNSVDLRYKVLAQIINSEKPKTLLLIGSSGGDIPSGGLDPKIHVDMVDIDPDLIKLSQKYLGYNPTPNQTFFTDDARHFLLTSNKIYDTVVIDIMKGLHAPYHMSSREAFEILRTRLSDTGLIFIHFLGGIGAEDISAASLTKTAEVVFPNVFLATYGNEENADYILVLSKQTRDIESLLRGKELKLVKANINEHLGRVLTDDLNPLDYYYIDKYQSWVDSTRSFGGLKGVFTL